jgi:hypothetical protein
MQGERKVFAGQIQGMCPAFRDCREFRAGLGMIGAKEPDDAATQRTPYS